MTPPDETADEPLPFPRRPPPPTPGLLLLWTAAAPAYRAFPLASAPQQIGRQATCGIPLTTDIVVSRRHAEVSFDAATSELVVRDDASKHGVYVDGVRIHGAHRVSLGRSIVRVGGSVFLATADLNPYLEDIASATPAPRTTLFDRDADAVIGPAMRALRSRVREAVKTGRPLLIQGERGTGKERIARLFHTAGRRSRGPYLAFNCAGFDRSLADAELFGAKRGAFTGAERDRKGAFEAAEGGVIFLDEIAELAPDVQSKLLRAVQDGWIRRVGSTEEICVDVAVVAASHADLRRLASAGKFREDLYDRLRHIVVRLPPLRERVEEIPFLVDLFVSRRDGAPRPSAAMIETCLLHGWPGNVRDLEIAVGDAIMFAAEKGLDLLELPAEALESTLLDAERPGEAESPDPTNAGLRSGRRETDDAEFAAIVRKHGGNVSAAARECGIKTSTAHDKYNRYLARSGGRSD